MFSFARLSCKITLTQTTKQQQKIPHSSRLFLHAQRILILSLFHLYTYRSGFEHVYCLEDYRFPADEGLVFDTPSSDEGLAFETPSSTLEASWSR